MTNLNIKQIQAIESQSNRLLIVAGAGTGKTTTIIEKIGYVQNALNLDYKNIIATTFTNKAATELKTRLVARFGAIAEAINIGTFHSLALDVLHQNDLFDRNATIISAEEQLKIVKEIMEKNKLLMTTPIKMAEKLQRYKEDMQEIMTPQEMDICKLYNQKLKANNSFDFADLIQMNITAWDKNPQLLANYQQKIKLLCVDEFQDVNNLQFKWIMKVLAEDMLLCCVGDPDQAIYGFRGANCDYILNFANYFPNADIVKLECNYRSGKIIIDAANRLIKNNKMRIEKTLYPFNESMQSSFGIRSFNSSRLEGIGIAKEILKIPSNEWNEVTILVRNRIQAAPVLDALSGMGIGCAGGGPEKAELKDIRAYMAFILNPRDIQSFKRSVLCSKNGIGETTVDKIIHLFVEDDLPDLLDAMKKVATTVTRGSEALLKFIMFIQQGKSFTNVNHLANHIIQNIEYPETKALSIAKWIELLPSVNVREYLSACEGSEKVNLMTIHGSKGLEFDYVFLPGWEDGVLPHHSAIGKELEEERRLAYVALTRARKKVYISYSSTRMVSNRLVQSNPSIFIKETNMLQASIQPQRDSKPTLQIGTTVFHKLHGRGSVVECGARAAMVKFFGCKKLIMLDDLAIKT